MLYHVVAMANDRVIGKDNKLPWYFSSDLKFFKQLTMGQTVIMGRKTFESIGKSLPGRENFVISRTARQSDGGIKYSTSVQDAVAAVKTKDGFVIGGASVFKETMSLVDGIYLTRIHADYTGDTFYPEVPEFFKEESRTLLQENPKLEVIFLKNQRKNK